MQLWFIQQLISALLIKLDEKTIKTGMDALLDIIEDAVVNSNTPMDDAIVLPLCNQIRQAFDVPDNDS
jgi:hypothetical protein